MNSLKTLTGLALALTLAACGGGGGGGPGTGTLNVGVTDAPGDDATAVVVQFDGVAIKRAGDNEQVITFGAPRTIDLLALQGGNAAALLQGTTVTAGNYEWMRLLVTATGDDLASYLEKTDGTQVPLRVPSGSQSGLKLVSGFTVPAGGTATFTIDFDLRKSITLPQAAGSPYFLKPALRIVDNTQVGTVSGTVGTAFLQDASCPATGAVRVIYVYAGAGATPDDVGGTGTQPVTSANVVTTNGVASYTAAFLPAGSYTLAYTCQAGTDNPEANDTLVFLGTRTVTVTANTTTTSNF